MNQNQSCFGNRKFYDLPTFDEECALPDSRATSKHDHGYDNVNKPDTDVGTGHCDNITPGETHQQNRQTKCSPSDDILMKTIEQNVVGKDKQFSGPFGLRKVVYCDFIASGRSLRFIEEYILDEVLPDYGNTHTTSTVTSLQTTLYRHEARDIVRNAVNASEHDAVIFTGSGCTAAIHKLIHALHITEAPVVFVSPYEHHSNLLPWREIGATVERIKETHTGTVDIQHLQSQLRKWKASGRQLIGCFAAASNITGVLADVNTITILLHRYGALALWDYATAGPYTEINMNPVILNDQQSLVYKDAVFISTHKFVGGVQTPGILVVKKKLLQNPVPSNCGGGSVFYVRRDGHRYLQEAEMREEGGTPAIVESVRAGLVFQLKEAIGAHNIMKREHSLCRRAVNSWKTVENLVLLGNQDIDHLPVFSFLIRHPQTNKFLHYNFVCTLLNDIFGIQARGGCACAGPYAQDLLGIDEALAKDIEDLLVEDSRLDRTHLRRYREYSEKEILRPGFTRLNLPFFLGEEEIDFTLEAVKMVANHGWKLLPQYMFNPETGEWRHKKHQVFKDRKWLGFVSYQDGQMTYQAPKFVAKGPVPVSHKDCLQKAEEIFSQGLKCKVQVADQTVLFEDAAEKLRWFTLPSEAYLWIQDPCFAAEKTYAPSPFQPAVYPKPCSHTETQPEEPQEMAAESILATEPNAPILEPTHSAPVCDNDPQVVFSSHKHSLKTNEIASVPLDDSPLSVQESIAEPSEAIATHQNEDPISKPQGHFREEMECTLTSGYLGDAPMHSEDSLATANVQTISSENHIGKNEVDHSTNEGHIPAIDKAKEDMSATEAAQEMVKFTNTAQSQEKKKMTKVEPQKPQTQKWMECKFGECFKPRVLLRADAPTPDAINTKHKWHPPPKCIFKKTVEAIEEYKMLQDGDRVLICLSGGKDSLSLLHTIHQYQFYARKQGINFDLGAVTVDPQTSSYDPSPLKGYLASLGVPYFYEEQSIMEAASASECTSICSFCSRMKRGRIYAAARRENYNVLALGQHLDDISESFLMSVFHNGILRTMKASYSIQDGDMRVIRPFVYVREKDLRKFAELKKLPIIPENCPACFEAPKERNRMKQLLAAQEILHPMLFASMQAALRPILAINKTRVNMKKIFQEANEATTDDL